MRDVLKLPLAFDKNEWFVLCSMTSLFVCYFIVPRIMPRGMTASVLLLFAAFGLTADVLIGVDYPIDFYTIMDSPKLELFDIIVYSANYPLYGYFYAYIVVKYARTGRRLLWLVPCWSGVSAGLELIALKFNVYAYQKGWTIGYSALAYLLVFAIGAVVIKLFERLWVGREKTA